MTANYYLLIAKWQNDLLLQMNNTVINVLLHDAHKTLEERLLKFPVAFPPSVLSIMSMCRKASDFEMTAYSAFFPSYIHHTSYITAKVGNKKRINKSKV